MVRLAGKRVYSRKAAEHAKGGIGGWAKFRVIYTVPRRVRVDREIWASGSKKERAVHGPVVTRSREPSGRSA
jgi:hypothetical protein